MINIYPSKKLFDSMSFIEKYLVEVDFHIKKLHKNGFEYIFYGTAFNSSGIVGIDDFPLGDPKEILRDCGGAYVLIVINGSDLTIYKSIYRNVDIFFRKVDGGYHISDDITSLLRDDDSINYEYCQRFIEGKVNTTSLTPFENIHKVVGGTITYLFEIGFKQEASITSIDSNITINEQIDITMKSITANKKVSLYLSGGFDSRLVFHNLIKNKISFDVFHFSPYSFENDNEINSVKSLCRYHDVNCYLLQRKIVKNTYGSVQKNISSPFDVGFVKEEIYGVDKYQDYMNDSSHVFLNGHGGDSVFVQNPSRNIGVEYLLKCNLIKFIYKTVELSMLKSCSLSGLIKDNLASLKLVINKKYPRDKYEHPWLAEYTPGTASYEHLSQIIYMTETTPIHELGVSTMFSPILSPNIFMNFVTGDYGENFNHKHDRLMMRNLSYSNYRDELLFEVKKRSSSRFIYHALQANKEVIQSSINKGEICNLLSLEKCKLNESLEYNTNVGFDSNTNSIIMLHRLQSFFNIQKNKGFL